MLVLNRRRVASTPKNIRLLLIVVCVVYLTYLISYLVTDDKPNPGRERSFYSYRSNLLKNASNKNDSKDLATRQSEKSHSKKNCKVFLFNFIVGIFSDESLHAFMNFRFPIFFTTFKSRIDNKHTQVPNSGFRCI